MNIQTIIHYFLHFGAPGIIAYVFFRKDWKKVWIILLLTMLVDVDHAFADPVFNPNRCGIGFHPLHSFMAMPFYVALLFFPKPLRVIGIGLCLHMVTDFIDCLFIFDQCGTCLEQSPLKNWLSNYFS